MSDIVFAHPWAASTLQVELRAPELGDVLEIAIKVRVRTMMDGSTRAYSRTPAKRSKHMTFTTISLTKAQEVKAFLIATQGSPIRFVDWEGKSWRGYITTDPNDVVAGRGTGNEPRPEAVSFSLTFEGVPM